MSNEDRALDTLERAVAPFVLAKDYDLLLELERKGVSLEHALAVAAYSGKHEQADWLLARGVRPTPRAVRFAIKKGRQITSRLWARVQIAPEYVDAVASALHTPLLEYMLNRAVLPTISAFHQLGSGTGRDDTLDTTLHLLLTRGDPWRLGTKALLHVMHLVSPQQLANALAVAPNRYNREKLLARAIRCCHEGAALEIARYGFGTKVTNRVALYTLGERNLSYAQRRPVDRVTEQLVKVWTVTNSPPLSAGTVARMIRLLSRRYMQHIGSFGSAAPFPEAIRRIVSLSEPQNRLRVLQDSMANFIVDRVESAEAHECRRLGKMSRHLDVEFERFKEWFENSLQGEIIEAQQLLAADSCPSRGGP